MASSNQLVLQIHLKESCSGGCPTSGEKTRKRKSRWDQPAEVNTDMGFHNNQPMIQPSLLAKSHSGLKHESSNVVFDLINRINTEDKRFLGCVQKVSRQMKDNTEAADGERNIEKDVPPGFLTPLSGKLIPSNTSYNSTDINQETGFPVKSPCEIVMGHPYGRFINRLAVCHGIPLAAVQKFGTTQSESLESWVIAPGVSFYRFPPLPPYPHDRIGAPTCAGDPAMISQTCRKKLT